MNLKLFDLFTSYYIIVILNHFPLNFPADDGSVLGPQAAGSHRDVIAPSVIAALLFVVLLVVIAVAVVIFVYMKKNKYRESSASMSYGLVKAGEEASEGADEIV